MPTNSLLLSRLKALAPSLRKQHSLPEYLAVLPRAAVVCVLRTVYPSTIRQTLPPDSVEVEDRLVNLQLMMRAILVDRLSPLVSFPATHSMAMYSMSPSISRRFFLLGTAGHRPDFYASAVPSSGAT
ncbi:hypothetical protein NM688_g7748 [Phlebia brevispora]|uniref:Uncharacterized protein n=1 Tax=Phlebia brevispora TaxID=194682 RepID=A0ACC1S1J6_9APHY|nr:hypothetical protein NM688_g7748 [Phlebia brevispora]